MENYFYINIKLPGNRVFFFPITNFKIFKRSIEIYSPQNKKGTLFKYFLLGISLTNLIKIFPKKISYSDIVLTDNKKLKFKEIKNIISNELNNNNLYFAISLGTPGIHKKPVLQILNSKGDILGYAKIGWNYQTIKNVENEVNILKYLSEKELNFSIPQILYYSKYADFNLYISTGAPDGTIKKTPKIISKELIKVFQEMCSLNIRVTKMNISEFWISKLQILNSIKNNEQKKIISKYMDIIQSEYNNALIPFCLNHGDFTPWNSKLINNRLYIYDWEYAKINYYPLGYDLFHFVLQTELLIKKKSNFKNIIKVIYNNFNYVYEGINIDKTMKIFDNCKKELLLSLYLLDKMLFYLMEGNKDKIIIYKKVLDLVIKNK